MEVRRNNNRGNGGGNNNMRNRNNNRSNGGGSGGGNSGGGRFNNGRRGGRSGFGEQAVPDRRQLRRAQELRDKHNYMAQDALKSGDRITAEYHFQHADHFFRVAAEIETALAEFESNRPQRWSEPSASTHTPASNAFDGEIPAFLEGGYNSAQSNENSDPSEQVSQKQPEDQPSTPNSQYGRPQRRYGRYSNRNSTGTGTGSEPQNTPEPPAEAPDDAY